MGDEEHGELNSVVCSSSASCDWVDRKGAAWSGVTTSLFALAVLVMLTVVVLDTMTLDDTPLALSAASL